MIEQIEAQLEQAQIAAISAMNDGAPTLEMSLDTEIDDPDVSQASGNQNSGNTLWIADMALVETKATAFLVGEEGFNGMITNDKFCLTRWGALELSWWRRPLRLRNAAD